MSSKKNNIVYSTDPEWRPDNQKTDQEIHPGKLEGQLAYIERDRKKRAGKTVTVVSNLKGDFRNLQKELQKHCGSGGSFKSGNIEIQGDHRDKIAEKLIAMGYKVKLAGG